MITRNVTNQIGKQKWVFDSLRPPHDCPAWRATSNLMAALRFGSLVVSSSSSSAVGHRSRRRLTQHSKRKRKSNYTHWRNGSGFQIQNLFSHLTFTSPERHPQKRLHDVICISTILTKSVGQVGPTVGLSEWNVFLIEKAPIITLFITSSRSWARTFLGLPNWNRMSDLKWTALVQGEVGGKCM